MIRDVRVVTIGNLSRNRYWGESDDAALRPALCTCTLVQVDSSWLLVDPSMADAEAMTRELERRRGLRPADIEAVFITHQHGDHWAGLAAFEEARWYAGPDVAEAINGTGKLPKKVEPVESGLGGGVKVIHTPGHTPDHRSLRLHWQGRSVVIAGDAVMTREFFGERQGYFNSVDFEQASETIEKLAQEVDIIVPGHDNVFLTGR